MKAGILLRAERGGKLSIPPYSSGRGQITAVTHVHDAVSWYRADRPRHPGRAHGQRAGIPGAREILR